MVPVEGGKETATDLERRRRGRDERGDEDAGVQRERVERVGRGCGIKTERQKKGRWK